MATFIRSNGSPGWTSLLVLVATLGCGPAAPYDIVPVTGKVTYEDGTPIPADSVTILFESEAPAVDAKTHPKAGRAELNSDGTFDTVTTSKAGDGAIVGRHKVVILPKDKQQILTKAVPREYTNKRDTPLKVDIQPGGASLEFKIQKPGK